MLVSKRFLPVFPANGGKEQKKYGFNARLAFQIASIPDRTCGF
jgi:hypothetical protein